MVLKVHWWGIGGTAQVGLRHGLGVIWEVGTMFLAGVIIGRIRKTFFHLFETKWRRLKVIFQTSATGELFAAKFARNWFLFLLALVGMPFGIFFGIVWPFSFFPDFGIFLGCNRGHDACKKRAPQKLGVGFAREKGCENNNQQRWTLFSVREGQRGEAGWKERALRFWCVWGNAEGHQHTFDK
jgi:hypothetical protein